MPKPFLSLTILFSLIIPALSANAVEQLSMKELALHCNHFADDPEGKDAIFCVRYIQGFIDGAVATDERVAVNVAAEYEATETYTERAKRTRGSNRLSKFGPTVYAEFCLGAPVQLKEVVEKVITDLETWNNSNEHVYARSAVYQTLRDHYPCDTDDDS
ncbi:MAG: Rap1a/Tai family immunity protein [Halioglobus sp.]